MTKEEREERINKFKHYTLGIPSIDEQHWELLEIIAKLKRAQKRKCARLAKKHLDKFFVKLDEHSVFEEALMDKIEFPYREYHKSHHPESTTKLLAIKNRTESNILSVSTADMDKHLKDHIDHADKQFVEFYNKWLAMVENTPPQ